MIREGKNGSGVGRCKLDVETLETVPQVSGNSGTGTRRRTDEKGKRDRQGHGGGVVDENIARVGCAGAVEEKVICGFGDMAGGTKLRVRLVEAMVGCAQPAPIEAHACTQTTSVTTVVLRHVSRAFVDKVRGVVEAEERGRGDAVAPCVEGQLDTSGKGGGEVMWFREGEAQ